jgi:hypothetical protein
MIRSISGVTAAIVLGLALTVALGELAAADAENVFAGKVLLLKKKPPGYFKTKDGFVSFLRGNSISTVYADEDNTWSFETMAFFRRPLGDYEVEMVFYNVEDGSGKNQRRFVDSYTQSTQDRNTRVLSGKARLTRPSFDANIKYMLVVQHKSAELAKGFFGTKGVSQAALDDQKRVEIEMKKMEESMKDLERKVKEQEEREKKDQENKKAAEDLF